MLEMFLRHSLSEDTYMQLLTKFAHMMSLMQVRFMEETGRSTKGMSFEEFLQALLTEKPGVRAKPKKARRGDGLDPEE
jgi:hypothetical protein